MPNYCENVLIIKGDLKSLKEIEEFILNEDKKLDFEKIIPQAYNVYIYNSNSQITKALEAYVNLKMSNSKEKEINYFLKEKDTEADFFVEGNNFHSFVDKYSKLKYEKKIEVISWHEWNNKNWGTKWNAMDQIYSYLEDIKEIQIGFSTAWSPPIPILKKLIEKFGEKVFIELTYSEPGMGFAGYINNKEEIEYDSDSIEYFKFCYEKEFLNEEEIENHGYTLEDITGKKEDEALMTFKLQLLVEKAKPFRVWMNQPFIFLI